MAEDGRRESEAEWRARMWRERMWRERVERERVERGKAGRGPNWDAFHAREVEDGQDGRGYGGLSEWSYRDRGEGRMFDRGEDYGRADSRGETARRGPERRGPEQRGPEQRGPEQRGPERRGPARWGAGPRERDRRD
jgi:hypothetical protein